MPANQHDSMARRLQLAAAAPDPKLQKALLRMACSFEVDAALLAMSRSTIVESRRLLAKNWSERIDNGHDDPLTNSRAKIDECRQLLTTLDLSTSLERGDQSAHGEPTLVPTAPIAPEAAELPAEANRDRAALSVHVFRDGVRFGWTVCGAGNDILGRGMAETELKARTNAFGAGMTYLNRLKDRLATGDISRH